MYTSFFGLNEKPFSITPDPRYLFLSERHGEALAHLVYGVTESGGFIQLTGEVGTGKTTLVRSLLLNQMPENANVAVVLNPQLSVIEFLATICEELHIEVVHNKGSVKALTDALNEHLLSAHAQGRRTILVVDEAQNLSPAVLEQVRLLTNLETSKQKLLQIILIGQPELRDLLARNDLRQLAQRITARYHLEPLSREETASYIEHRLKVAGALGEVFGSGAKKEVFRLSHGVPRLINVICDRALLGAYAQEARRVTARLIRQAAAEVKGQLERSPWIRRTAIAAGLVGAAIIASSLWSITQRELQTQPVAIAEEPVAAAQPEPEPIVVQQVEPPGEPEPAPTLHEQLQLADELTRTDYALAELFEVWGIEYRTGGRDACAQASDAGLSCLYQKASWTGLQQMNRPAILRVTHAVTEIIRSWFGEFMLLWRPPSGSVVSLRLGSEGPVVAWLRNSLAAIDGRYASEDLQSEIYDAELEQIVRRFQREHRLDIDGLAGQQTQIIINSLLAVEGTPRLSTPRLAQD
jgi:general secretion pathway protein A